jgi:4-hydroxybenzoate polyprenyltransferase
VNPVVALIKAARPKQWVKQGLLTVAIVFSGKYRDVDSLLAVAMGIAFFSMIASAGYLFNDLKDVEADRKHPKKKNRPIAAGHVPIPLAWAAAAALFFGGVAGSFLLINQDFGVTAVAYLLITLSYSQFFKRAAVLDVMGIAAGFIVRAVAGAEAIDVDSSGWFLTCIGFGALFIGLCKRLAEIRLLEGGAGEHRRALNDYAEPVLYQLIGIAAACSLLSYALYTFDPSAPAGIMATLPVVIYAVFRYLLLVEMAGAGGEPSQTLLKDRPLQISVVLFCSIALAAIHFGT